MRAVDALRSESGVVLVMALVVILILATIVLAVSQMTTGEVEIHRLTRWDTLTQYLAQAGAEHQIYLLKENRNAGAVSSTNYPLLPGETAGSGKFWYSTSLSCSLNCTGTPTLRRWAIDSSGEIRDCPTPCTTALQRRTVRVQVEITYSGSSPTRVTLLRWEEVYP